MSVEKISDTVKKPDEGNPDEKTLKARKDFKELIDYWHTCSAGFKPKIMQATNNLKNMTKADDFRKDQIEDDKKIQRLIGIAHFLAEGSEYADNKNMKYVITDGIEEEREEKIEKMKGDMKREARIFAEMEKTLEREWARRIFTLLDELRRDNKERSKELDEELKTDISKLKTVNKVSEHHQKMLRHCNESHLLLAALEQLEELVKKHPDALKPEDTASIGKMRQEEEKHMDERFAKTEVQKKQVNKRFAELAEKEEANPKL